MIPEIKSSSPSVDDDPEFKEKFDAYTKQQKRGQLLFWGCFCVTIAAFAPLGAYLAQPSKATLGALVAVVSLIACNCLFLCKHTHDSSAHLDDIYKNTVAGQEYVRIVNRDGVTSALKNTPAGRAFIQSVAETQNV